jgi:mannose-6-phosphate isomerase-like protein (cupin superfamily)
MGQSGQGHSTAGVVLVAVGEDRFSEHRGLGVSAIQFKVCPQDSDGILILENSFHAPGGPARHLHYEQDEWFYPVDGQFVVEVGDERFTVGPGDSLVAPRRVPHAWAFVGPAHGKILIAFNPAGKMEAFFREVTKTNQMPRQDAELWRSHGMELVGPPLALSQE